MALLRTDKRSAPISELATKHQLHPNQMTQWKAGQAIHKLAKDV
jgi:hypothetical protein